MSTTAALQHLDHDIWQALSGARLAQRRIDAVRDALLERLKCAYRLEGDTRHLRQQVADLRIHLRDRDAHIRNLEAQLRPLLLAQEPPHEQGALL